MKNKISVILICLGFILTTSCSKDEDPTPPAETAEQLLTKSAWKIDELRWNQVNTSGGGSAYYYKRGTTGNISNLDNESVLFTTSGTGTYTLGNVSSPLAWQFNNSEKTKITFIITYAVGSPLTVYWENMVLSSTTLRYSEYFTTSAGINSLASGTRTH